MVAGTRTFSLEDAFLAPHILNPPPTRHALLAFLLALAAVLHVGTAAWGDLYDGVEGQVAGGAREILTSRQWLVPTNDGVPLLQTPPLAYWTVAVSYKIFGVSPAAARLPIALAMIGSVALTFLIGERLAGYWRGFAAGLIYLCSAGSFLLGRLVAPDNLSCFFIVGAFYCGLCGYQRRKFRRVWFGGFWLCAALATLTEGPVALVLLGTVLVLLSIFFREARLRFGSLFHWSNLLLFAAIVGPWFVWGLNHFPGFQAEFFSFVDSDASPSRAFFLFSQLAWWFPAFFLILPGLVFASRKIIRPDEFAFGDALPLCWLAVAIIAGLFVGGRQAVSSVVAGPALALFVACAWERISRPLRAAGVLLAVAAGAAVTLLAYFAPEIIETFLRCSLADSIWFSTRPLLQVSLAALVISAIAAVLLIKQRNEVVLVLALAAMVPIGFCLIEIGARAAPFLSLAEAAQFLNPRLGRSGEVVLEGSVRSGSSLSFYLEKRFFLVNQPPNSLERSTASQSKYLDEHFLLEAWDRSDPIYLIIDEGRVSYWRQLITQRVHIYHQVTTCGHRIVLSNQL